MSFLKNIMSPFVEFKEDPATGSKDGKSKSVAKEEVRIDEVTGARITVKAPIATPAAPQGAAVDYLKHFEDLVEEANAKNPLFQGTDFKEFIDSKVDVEAIADEAVRYKTAFNVLKRTGLTKEKLVSTGREYINLINGDLKGFTDAYAQQYKKDVEQNEILLQQKANELHELNERVNLLSQDIKNISQEITNSKSQLDSNKNAFILAGQHKVSEIEAELKKIEQYF